MLRSHTVFSKDRKAVFSKMISEFLWLTLLTVNDDEREILREKVNEWVKLFKKTFKFTGREITNEFLMSIGYLEGAHEKSCPIYKKLNT